MNISKVLFATIATILMTATMAFGQDQLPEVELKDIDGNEVNIADLASNGKITVLNFWATWCIPCKKELNNIAEMYEDWQEMYDMELVAVSIDDAKTKARVKSYVNGQAWEYLVLLDDNQSLKRALNFQEVPFTLLIDAEGNIVERMTGYEEGHEFELEDKIAELAEK